MKTSSSIIKEFLSRQEVGFEFTRPSLEAALGPTVPMGAISGFVNRLKTEGYTTARSARTRDNRLLETHTLVKPLHDFNVRDTIKEDRPGKRGPGGGGPTTRERLCEMLMTVATEIERMKVTLDDYTDVELIAELGKRANLKK